ncbi:MAG TPA: hypothetical protein VFR97_10625 [Capillimicrobium sp.]|nr:hypothetical protein [Capillimicrobium sp.]
MLRRLLIGAATLAALPASAAAQDAPTYHYDAFFQGDFEWSLHQASEGGCTQDQSAAFHATGLIRDVVVQEGRLVKGGTTGERAFSGGRISELTTDDRGTQKACSGTGVRALGPAVLQPNVDPARPLEPVRDIVFGLGAGLELAVDCEFRDGGGGPERHVVSPAGMVPGTALAAVWGDVFHIPAESAGAPKITYRFSRAVPDASCPGYEPDVTVSCEMRGSGTIELTQTGAEGVPDEDELIAPLVDEVEIRKDASAAEGMVTCQVRCVVKARAFPRGGRAGKGRPRALAAAVRPLGRARRTLRPDVPTRVVVRFPAAARPAIRRAGGVRLVFAIAPKGGRTVTRTVVARL